MAPSPPGDGLAPQAHSVLVVDDTAANRRLYSGLLSRAGFHVQTAVDGLDALEHIERRRPSLVLLDFLMPGMNGVGVLRRIRESPVTAPLPVVMLTASTALDDIEAALEAGANDYITKPVNGRILVNRVMTLIQADRDRESASRGRHADSLRAELDEAAQVQQAQLPHTPIEWHDWRVSGAVLPSGLVGGDVFDILVTDDERLVAVLLDVSGHGTGSALVAAETRAELKTLLGTLPLGDAIERLNARMERRETGRYSCLAALEISGTTVRVVNAGLPPVCLLRNAVPLHQITASGLPVGMFGAASYDVTEFRAQRGDRLVVLSDGLTEPFGWADDSIGAIQRLELVPRDGLDPPDPAELRQRMERLSRGFSPQMVDDATVVVIDLVGTMNQELTLTAHPDAIAHAVQWVVSQKPDWADESALDHGVTEALTNAVLHGALRLRSDSRETGGYDEYLKSAETLAEAPDVPAIHVELLLTDRNFGVRISWDGAACPAERRRPPEQIDPLRASGMGMTIIHALFSRVLWYDEGRSMELWLDRDNLQRHLRGVPEHLKEARRRSE